MDEKKKEKKPILELFNDGDIGVLLCPECGVGNMKHYRVEVFDRVEDDRFGLHLTIEDGKMKRDQGMTDNPSIRRGGLSVFFWCENCEDLSVLHIAQHKGRTEVFMGTIK